MSQRWLKFLKQFGLRGKTLPIPMGEESLDRVVQDPQMFERYDVLFQLYGPLPGSLWVPYQCPTLFASIDKLGITPKAKGLSPTYNAPRPPDAWQWLGPETMVIVDLPGTQTIEMGAILMKKGAQFISTFDHWPTSPKNPSAMPAIDAEKIINAMYELAPEVYEARRELSPNVAPVWLCDSRRLSDGLLEPTPGTFDNRYFIDDSILAGTKTLKKGGIKRVVYFNEERTIKPLPDLVPFLIEAKKSGLSLEQVTLSDENTWAVPEPMDEPFMRKLPIKGFRRSDMGGFGQMVPVPSEGSYSSGGGGG